MTEPAIRARATGSHQGFTGSPSFPKLRGWRARTSPNERGESTPRRLQFIAEGASRTVASGFNLNIRGDYTLPSSMLWVTNGPNNLRVESTPTIQALCARFPVLETWNLPKMLAARHLDLAVPSSEDEAPPPAEAEQFTSPDSHESWREMCISISRSPSSRRASLPGCTVG